MEENEQGQLARELYERLGGAENILQATNCMTRLRVQLAKKDDALVAAVKGVNGVIGALDAGEEFQIVLGPGRAQAVADEVRKLLEADRKTAQKKPVSATVGDGKALQAAIRAKNATPIKLLFRRIASIFLPLISGFIACGLITGVLGVWLKAMPDMANAPLVKLLSVFGNAVFWGMNLFVGWSAAQVFGGTPILGGVLAAIISHPALSGVAFSDAALVPGRGGVISVVLAAGFGAWLEKRLHRVVPELFDLFLTPLLTVLIAGAATIFVLQPVGGVLSDFFGRSATTAIEAGGAATGFALGGLWLPMVMLGVHQAITPIHVDLIARYGVTILLPILAMAGAGQVGASLAVYVKTKSRRLKKIVASALPVGLMGVGEPLIYGVTLPLGKPFVGACIGGAAGGAVQAHFAVGAATLGISGLPLAGATDNIPAYLTGVVVAYAVGFAATWLLGFDDPVDESDAEQNG
ncbi:MAG: PTS transporter subunit EIIC [Selenomonadaceae bacterium]|nr:PTS transporter subunit EIIC [Selenomonadaceae bacterium]